VLNGILYLLRTGCQWRLLPKGFPPWSTVHTWYRRWRLDGTWECIHNHDGTFTVRFFHGGTPTYVTVDRSLAADGKGQLPYAHTQKQASSPSDKLWVALAEKAYALLAESGWSRPSGVRNAYDALSVGWEGDAVEQVTGRAATDLPITGTGSLYAVVNAFRSGKLLGLDTKPVTSSSVVPDHTYAMVGYNASAGMFKLYNPWGKVQEVSGRTIVANFDHWNQATG
jgi:transposase